MTGTELRPCTNAVGTVTAIPCAASSAGVPIIAVQSLSPDAKITAGAGDHFARSQRILAVHDGHRGQIAVDLAQGAVAGRVCAGDDELGTGRRNRMGGPVQQRLDDRRCGEVGDVEHRAGSVAQRHRLTQHGVGQPGDDSHLAIEFPCQQGDLQIEGVVVIGADDSGRVRHPSLGQPHRAVDDHDLGARALQFLDDPHPQGVVAADDGVAGHSARLLWLLLCCQMTDDGPR